MVLTALAGGGGGLTEASGVVDWIPAKEPG